MRACGWEGRNSSLGYYITASRLLQPAEASFEVDAGFVPWWFGASFTRLVEEGGGLHLGDRCCVERHMLSLGNRLLGAKAPVFY